MGGSQLRTPEESQEARRIIIPRRAGEAETEETRRLYDQAVATVRQLQQVSRTITLPADVRAEIESRQRIVESMRRTGVPYLQDRYNNELDEVLAVLALAKRASDAGRSVDALPLLERATAMMQFLGRLYSGEVGFMINGVPPNLRAGTQTHNDLLDSVEVVILDVGTPNAARADKVMRAFNLYVQNETAYNTDDVAIRGERDALVEFIIDNGVRAGTDKAARERNPYTAEQSARDETRLQRFEANIARISAMLRQESVQRVTAWKDDITGRMTQLSAEDASRGLMESLRQDLDALLARLGNERTAREVRDEDLLSLENRYLMLTGRPPVPTREARDEQLQLSAAELRGSGTRSDRNAAREGTQEWFGAQALALITGGNREIAALAVAMGFLERTASGSTGGARAILGNERYDAIIAVISRRGDLSPVRASQFATEIEVATLSADAARLERGYRIRGRGTARERLTRINEAARVARERIDAGDIEGARRLLDMTSRYAMYLDSARGRDWAASGEMETALDTEIRGQNGQQAFEDAITRNQFAAQITDFRSSLSQWGRGIADQKRVVESGLTHVEELVAQGNFREAQGALLRLIMYADSVDKLGIRRGGKIESMNPRFDGSGMERALGAFARGQTQIDGRGVETVFNESYVAAQRTAVDVEAARLGDLATRNRWTVGRETVDLALAGARARAQQGDYEGAFRLLRYVQEFYGAPAAARAASGSLPAQAARSEGWRYRLAARDGAGFVEGRNRLIDAMRMEAEATTPERQRAAAQLFQLGTQRIAECDMLMASSYQLRQRYDGAIPFIEGNAQTRGRIVIGYDAQNNPLYLDLARIREYESTHSGDTALGTGMGLTALFRQLQTAAGNGDISAYNRIVEVIFGRYDSRTGTTVGGRFWLVAGRAARMQAIDRIVTQLGDLSGFTSSLPAYDGSVERRRALETSRTALIARLEAARYTNEDITARQGEGPSIMDSYAGLLSNVDRERRTALAVSVITEQMSLGDQFRQAVGYPGGDITTETRTHLDESRRFLTEARTAAIEGRFDDASRLYQRAVRSRTNALQTYWARSVITTSDVLTAHRRPLDDRRAMEQAFPILRMQHDELELEQYQEAHMMVFRDILFGNTPPGETARAHGERMQRRLQGTVMIESSIFGIPAGSTAQQILDNFRDSQASVRGYVYAAWRGEDRAMQESDPQARADYMAMAEHEYSSARTEIQEMQRRAEANRMIAQVAVLAVGIAACFIPYVGIYIGGAIFVGSQVEGMVTEYRMRGEVSGESWAMLGITVATLGFAAVGGIVRTFAVGARVSAEGFAVAGNLARAEQLLASASRYATMSRVFTGTAVTLGLGISGYMEYSAYRMYQEAQRTTDPVRREMLLHQAMLTAGMGLLPIIHMGVAYGYRGMTAPPRMRAAAALEEMVPARELVPGEAAEAPLASRLRTADGLFEFMGRLRSTEASVRTAAEAELATIPNAAMRTSVARLASDARIGNATYLNLLRSLQNGELTPYGRAELEGALGRLTPELPPEGGPGGGPRGGGPRTTRPEVDAAGLSESGGLFGFLQDLLVPNGAPAPALNARAAARATLARLRLDPRTTRVADAIDNIVGNPERGIAGNPAICAAIEGERAVNPSARPPDFADIDPFTSRGLGNAARGIGRFVREPVREAAVLEATNGLPIEDAVGQPVPVRPGQAEGVGTAVPVRAMAGEGPAGGGRGPVGGEPVPGRVGPAETGGPATGGRGTGGGARPTRGAAPRGPAEGEAPAQAGGPQTNVTIINQPPAPQPGRIVRAGRWFGRQAVGGYRGVRRWARGDAALENVPVLEAETDAMIAQRIDATVAQNPQNVVAMMRMIYDRAMSPQTRVATRAQCMEILEALYRHPQVQRLIAADPALAEMQGNIVRGIDTNVQVQGIAGRTPEVRRQTYLDSLPELTQVQRGIMVDALEAQGATQGLPPLAATAEVLGLELNATQRANALLRLAETGRIPQGAIVNEMALARAGAAESLTAISAEGNAISEAIRAGLLRRVRNNQVPGGDPARSFDATVLDTLRSPEVAAAVERAHGRQARVRYEAAVREGTLAEVMDRLPGSMRAPAAEGAVELPATARNRMAQDMSDVAGFVSRLRATPQISEGLTTMGTLGERFNTIMVETRARGGARAAAGRPLGVGQWTGRQARRAGRVLYYAEPTWGVRSGIGEFAAEARAGGWRAGVRNSLFTGRTLLRLGHAAGWGIGMYYAIPALRDWYTGAADIRRGNQMANEIYGMNVSDENARWLTGTAGERFGRSLVVGDSRLKPQNPDDLRGILLSEQLGNIWIDRTKVNDALTDGRAMAGALSDINGRLMTANGPAGEDRTTARTELTARLGRLGITTEDVRSALIREKERSLNRQLDANESAQVQAMEPADMIAEFLRLRGGRTQLDMSDMTALRLGDWQRRGIAIDARRAVVQTYLDDMGMAGTALSDTAQFFSRRENADAFLFLWSSARAGSIPVTYLDNMITYLMASATPGGPTNLAEMQRQSARTPRAMATELRSFYENMPGEYVARVDALERTATSGTPDEQARATRELSSLHLGELLRRRAIAQGFYLDIPQADGTMRGIRPSSFLQALDERAWVVESFRAPFETMLAGFRSNPGALRALNALTVRDNEDIYGDPVALATRLALVGGRTRGADNTERPFTDEVNRLLVDAASGDAAARQRAEGQLSTLLSQCGLALSAVRSRLSIAGRQQVTVEDLVEMIGDNARAEGVIGPSILVSAADRSMLGAADGPALARLVARYSDAQGGLMRWITENRDSITDLHAILAYIQQNSSGGFRNTQDAASFADRNASLFRTSGWFNARARTRAELEAAARRAVPAVPGRTPAQTPATTREFPGVTALEMVPERAQPAQAPVTVTLELTAQQRQQASAFYSSERGQALGTMIDGLLDGMYSATGSDSAVLRQVFGESTTVDGNITAPERARTAVREEIFRILMSTNRADVTMRGTWGITVTGTGDAMRVTVDMARARDPLRNRIRQFTLERKRAEAAARGSAAPATQPGAPRTQ